MKALSHKQAQQETPQSSQLSRFRDSKKDLSFNYDNSPAFARKLLNDLPIPSKTWCADLNFKDDSYIRKLRNGERIITQKLAEDIIKLGGIYTTVYLRWKLEIDMYRQEKGWE